MSIKSMEEALSFLCEEKGLSVFENQQLCLSFIADIVPQSEAERRLLKVCFESGAIHNLLSKNPKSLGEINLLLKQEAYNMNTNYYVDQEAAMQALGWFARGALHWHTEADMFDNSSNTNDNDIIKDPWEQYTLGFKYEFGEGVSQDYYKAVQWYKKSAVQGNAWAQHRLGECYANGKGVNQDYKEAVKYYIKAADSGNDHSAQLSLGLCYYFGNGVNQDYNQAAYWIRKAAEQDNSGAQNWLGFLYENGFGVQKDDAEAARWYEKSAKE